MKYIYFVDNFGRTSLEYKGDNEKKMLETIKKISNILDPDTNRYIMITTKELPIWTIETPYTKENHNTKSK